jgi:sec-independent protein translocase protein TatC
VASVASVRQRRQHRAAGSPMGLFDHLAELRRRLLVAVVAVTVGGIAVFVVFDHLLGFLLMPYCHAVGPGHACNLYVTAPLDGLSIRVKVAAYGGLLLASPVVLWELWRFVAPGLRPGERRGAFWFVGASVLLFAGGAAVAYASFGHALRFLDAVGGPSLHELYSPSSYIGLLILMMAVFGLAFELPVFLVALQMAGIVTPAKLASWRRWAIVVLVTVAGVITPSSDPFSMLALAVPLVVFYEGAIVVGRLLIRARRKTPAIEGTAAAAETAAVGGPT